MICQKVAIVNQKGGTGKTTTAIHLAVALGKLGKKVLAVDLDPQGNFSFSLGLDELPNTIVEAFEHKMPLSECIYQQEGIWILPSHRGLADLELTWVNTNQRNHQLKELLKPIEASFDFILIDCPPSLSLLTINALAFSVGVLIPLQFEVLSLQGLKMIAKTIEEIKPSLNPDLKILGILPVMYDKRKNITVEIKQFITDNFEFKIFERFIRTDVKLVEAPSFGKSTIEYAPQSGASKDYMAFGEEFLKEF